MTRAGTDLEYAVVVFELQELGEASLKFGAEH